MSPACILSEKSLKTRQTDGFAVCWTKGWWKSVRDIGPRAWVSKRKISKILFLEKAYKVSIVYFTGLPVVLSLYRLYSSRVGLQIQSKPPVTRWCNGLSLAGKRLKKHSCHSASRISHVTCPYSDLFAENFLNSSHMHKQWIPDHFSLWLRGLGTRLHLHL